MALDALILKGDFNHPNVCWRGKTVGHKQSRKLLESISDYLLTQPIQMAMREVP